MKSTGIVRKVDELGRIVLPIELRRTLDIAEKDSIEIYVDGSSIILKKYEPTCVFCGDAKNITVYQGKNVCAKEALQACGASFFMRVSARLFTKSLLLFGFLNWKTGRKSDKMETNNMEGVSICSIGCWRKN